MQNIIVTNLGEACRTSPLHLHNGHADGGPHFIPDQARVLNSVEINSDSPDLEAAFEKAGPREKIFFDPGVTRAAIVTCGGLCPGLNNVIRSLVLELYHNYGVRDIRGIRYGYDGMGRRPFDTVVALDPNIVDAIDRQGGSMLGCSRGNPPLEEMAGFLLENRIDMLFAIGGDGTQRGAWEISKELQRRGAPVAVVGIPKTIDNDILFVERTFGVSTAIDRARDVLDAAHAEAKSYPNGIALVKLMGRESGFIAAGATLASQQVNFVLIPEAPFRLEGETGFLAVLKERILKRHHALVVVAEGAGQELMPGERGKDVAGNVLNKDIGGFLKESISGYFRQENIPFNLKYIDPSYYIRSVAADTEDCVLCDLYARHAVHAAMAGKTGIIIGKLSHFVHVPMEMATAARQKVRLGSDFWRSVLASTGQPERMI